MTNRDSVSETFQNLLDVIRKEKSLADFRQFLRSASPSVFNEKDTKFRGTLIHWAALYDRKEILMAIHDFLRKTIKFTEIRKIFYQKDGVGASALHWCAEENALNSYQFFLDTYPKLLSSVNNQGRTPLHRAAEKNQQAIVEAICKYDEETNEEMDAWLILKKDNDDATALELSSDAEIKLRLQTSALRKHALQPMLGRHLTTQRYYLTQPPIATPRFEDSERYCRSEKHDLIKQLGKKAELCYTSSTELKNGMKAHAGSYGTISQMLGDKFKVTDETPEHHPSDAILYDAILTYKNKCCANVVDEFSTKRKGSAIDVGHHNDYPCIMVHINEDTIHKTFKTKNPSPAAFEGWVNFLLSYFTGLVNYNAYKIGLPIELGRRGSFGFILPTVSPTGASFRISMGIVPKNYIDLLIEVLVIFDKALTTIIDNTLDFAELPDDTFYYSKKHKNYLNKKYPDVKPKDALQLLWAQVEKNGQTTVQNITRTAFARDGIACAAFNACIEQKKLDPEAAFNQALLWAIENIDVTNNKLSFNQTNVFEYSKKLSESAYLTKDEDFWQLIKLIHDRIHELDDETTRACLQQVATCIKEQTLQNLYPAFELLHNAIFIYSINTRDEEDYGDGYGSDSETEDDPENPKLFAKKIITHSGMRAIWGAISACNNRVSKIRIYLQEAYYEVPLGIHMIKLLEEWNSVTVVKEISKANVIMYDINACITNEQAIQDRLTINDLTEERKYIILDATSASSSQVRKFLPLITNENSRAHTLLVVESGFKNQQLGGDKNPHGIIRIFSRDKKRRDEFYSAIKKIEKPVVSPTSHRYRHQMKLFGATQSNQAILSKPEPKFKKWIVPKRG